MLGLALKAPIKKFITGSVKFVIEKVGIFTTTAVGGAVGETAYHLFIDYRDVNNALKDEERAEK